MLNATAFVEVLKSYTTRMSRRFGEVKQVEKRFRGDVMQPICGMLYIDGAAFQSFDELIEGQIPFKLSFVKAADKVEVRNILSRERQR